MLYQSDYNQYNWEKFEFDNQEISTLTYTIEHPKWGYIMGEWNRLNKYTYFLNTTRLIFENQEFDIIPTQQKKEI